jgi:Protein of unknown function (DUF2848)
VSPRILSLTLQEKSNARSSKVAIEQAVDPCALIGRHVADGRLGEGTLMFCGTLAAHGGVQATDEFAFEIEDPVLDRKIAHAYRVQTLPILG